MTSSASQAMGSVASTDLDQLLAAAHRRDRDADAVWPAAAAAIELLIWQGKFGDARDLAEKTVADLHNEPGLLLEQDSPFDEAILVGCAEIGDDPALVLGRLQNLVRSGSVLGKRIAWLLNALPDKSPYQLVSGAALPLPPRPLTERDTELVNRVPAELDSEELTRLWFAARRCGMSEVAIRLIDAGMQPPEFTMAAWTADQLIAVDRVGTASAVLLDAFPIWRPEHPWEMVPISLMLQPHTRSAISEDLRQIVLDKVDIAPLLEILEL